MIGKIHLACGQHEDRCMCNEPQQCPGCFRSYPKNRMRPDGFCSVTCLRGHRVNGYFERRDKAR